MAHAMGCFVRLVKVLLGGDAIADNKVECGEGLGILGVDVSVSARGFAFRPSRDKVVKWQLELEHVLATGKLEQGHAAKLAGKLSWGCTQMFNKFGRAMLRPIFDQQSRRDGKVGLELGRALQWWQSVLKLELCERRDWNTTFFPDVHRFCDASSTPPHLGAVVFVDDVIMWTHLAPADDLVDSFKRRSDNQIMGLELLAISLGMCTFEHWIRGRKIVIHCDNTGSEVTQVLSSGGDALCWQASVRRGSARSWDHAQIVHQH